MSVLRSVLLALAAVALLLPGLASASEKKKEKHIVKHKTVLEVGQPLRLDIEGALESCKDFDCWLWISEINDEALYLVEVDGEGNFVVFAKEEEEEEEEEEAEEDAADIVIEGATGVKVKLAAEPDPEEPCDKLSLAEPELDEEGEPIKDESWKDLPLLTDEHLAKCKRETGAAGKYTVEKATGALGDDRSLTVSSDLLPTGNFELSTNGYWGAMLEGVAIGTPGKTGVVKVLR